MRQGLLIYVLIKNSTLLFQSVVGVVSGVLNLLQFRVIELAKQLVVGLPVGSLILFGNPSEVHVVMQMNVLGSSVATPGTAADGRSHRHTIVHGTGVCLGLRLTDHDTANTSYHSQSVDMILIEGEDTNGMTLAAYFMDRHDSIDSVLELAFVLMNSQYGGKFLTTPGTSFPDDSGR